MGDGLPDGGPESGEDSELGRGVAEAEAEAV